MRILILLFAFLTCASAIGADDKHTQELYDASCTVCHETGVADAPKTGNPDDWEPRLQKGMNDLIKSTSEGHGAMPPGSMCPDCTESDIRALIEFMSE